MEEPSLHSDIRSL